MVRRASPSLREAVLGSGVLRMGRRVAIEAGGPSGMMMVLQREHSRNERRPSARRETNVSALVNTSPCAARLSCAALLNLVVVVCALSFLIHLPALTAQACFIDDQQYVIDNALVQNPSWRSARRFLGEILHPSTVRGYYQPLTMLSLMLDCAFSEPPYFMRTFHRTNLALHVANVGLLCVLLSQMSFGPWAAGAASLLFGVHPLTVDSVFWLSERKTLLATFFVLWSLISYLCHTRRGSRRWWIASLAAYVLALLAKPTSLPLPVAMLLLDWWPLRRKGKALMWEKTPFFLAMALFAVVVCVSQHRSAGFGNAGHDWPHAALVACHNIIFYLSKVIWPAHLSPYYEYEHFGLSHPMAIAGLLGTGLLVPLLVGSRRRTRAVWSGMLVFGILLLPTLGFIQVTPTIAANRYVYLPALGLVLMAAALLTWLWGGTPDDDLSRRRQVVLVLIFLIAAAEAGMTRRYAACWQDSARLYERALSVSPHSPKLYTGMGSVLAARGRYREAIPYYRRSIDIAPTAVAYQHLAWALTEDGNDLDEPVLYYRAALQIDPTFVWAYVGWGGLLQMQGRMEEAIQRYGEALRVKPDFNRAHQALGRAFVLAGRPVEGVNHLAAAVDLNAADPFALADLAWVLSTHPDAAIRAPDKGLAFAQRAAALSRRQNALVLDVLAAAYAAQGQFELAMRTAQDAAERATGVSGRKYTAQIARHLRFYQRGLPCHSVTDEWRRPFLSERSPDRSAATDASTQGLE